MGSTEALQLRERAALLRRVAGIRIHGDAEVNRELLALAASVEDKARALEVSQERAA
jgi:hypothetical protein